MFAEVREVLVQLFHTLFVRFDALALESFLELSINVSKILHLNTIMSEGEAEKKKKKKARTLFRLLSSYRR